MTEGPLYPPLDPYWSDTLSVTGGHELYVETCGNPLGRPAIVLHGGPGACCLPDHRRFFDPEQYRIVLLDQRGAGRSRPSGSVDHNTTPDLIADLEQVRRCLGIERWMLFGGSWGSTLALAYAAEHPERVAAMILRGTWLARSDDIAWHMNGLRALAPDRWEDFVAAIPKHEHGDLLAAYWRRLSAEEPEVRLAAARAWCAFEQHFTKLVPSDETSVRSDEESVALARIEAHYFRHGCFLNPERLIAGVARLNRVPAVIVHGRYDWLARLEGAWTLAQAWPAAKFEIVPDAAHSAFEPGIRARLIAATDRFATLNPWE